MGKGMFVAGGHGNAKGQVLRSGGQGWNDHQRIVRRGFHRPLHRRIGVATKHIVEAQHITKKQHVEVSLIGNARQVRPIAQRVDRQSFVSGMGPKAWRAATAHTGLLIECKQKRFWIGHRDSCK
ncbi:hypothetical protein D3C85_1310150 [compost metagenome]